jgi:hypothetical protein
MALAAEGYFSLLAYRLYSTTLDAVMAPAQAFGEGWWLSPV